MTFALAVTFDGIEPSDALRANVIERAGRLERFAGDIINCHVVVVAAASHRQQQGNAFGIHIRLTLRGGEIEVGGHATPGRHEDPYVAVADTFDALRRRIEDRVRQGRGDAKKHAG